MRCVRPALVLAWLTTGCDPDLVTDSGRLGIDVALHWPATLPPYERVPVVAGSQWCPTIVGYFGQPGDGDSYYERDLDDCFDISVERPATWDGACAQLDAAGELRVAMTPTECDDRDHASIPVDSEMVVVDVVDPMDVHGQLHANDDVLFETLLLPAPDTSFPDDWRTEPGGAMLVAEGGIVYVQPGLTTADGRSAAWSGGAISGASADGVVLDGDRLDLEIRGEPGQRISPTLTLAGSLHSLGTIETVPVDAAASIEVVSGYGLEVGHPQLGGPTTWTEWISLRAVVRDGSGHAIWGMPIEWSVVDGYLSLQADEELQWATAVPDYAMVADVCADGPLEPERRTAIVQARLGELSDVAELEWIAMPAIPGAEPPFDEWLALCEGPDGPDGCGCTAGSRGSTLWLIVLAAMLRRRAQAP